MSANLSPARLSLYNDLTPEQRELCGKMDACEQAPGYSTLQHGIDCFANYEFLLDVIWYERFDHAHLRLPDWFPVYAKDIYANVHDMDTAERYIVFHDCGKFACLEIDAEGKRHFPNHAEVSARIFREHFDDAVAARLIAEDMTFHTIKDAGIDAFLARCDKKDICTLLLASFSEIHANAAIFGGMDSTSFKMKWKQLDKRGKAICKRLFGGKGE